MHAIGPGEMRIGAAVVGGRSRASLSLAEALAGARSRAGLELAEVEARTKIRGRYLRALEAEAWDDLPSHAYAKGYLRSYAELLELDADTLVDEYRRQVEGAELTGARQHPEGVLDAGHQRPLPGSPSAGPRRVTLIAIGALLALATLAAIGLLGDDESDEPARQNPRARTERDGRGVERERRRERRDAAGPLTLGLKIDAPVEVCLLDEGGTELIDGQVLAAGSRDEFTAPRFRLRFPAGFRPGQLKLELDGEPAQLERVRGPAAFTIEPPRRIRKAAPPENSCP
jgi:cytoskeleton protein RodZ